MELTEQVTGRVLFGSWSLIPDLVPSTLGSPASFQLLPFPPLAALCRWGSHGRARRLVPSLPWTVRTNIRMASPAALLTLQLYRPLSDTWDRESTW